MALKKPKNSGASKQASGNKATGVFTKIGQTLGLKKTPREEVLDEQKLINEIIQENDKLRDKLQTISFRAKNIPEKQMAEDQRKIAMLIVKLSDYDISSMPDTREIDRALFMLCDELVDAYQKGDTLTSTYIIQTLTYGIVNGHKPLLENEKNRESEVMEWREKKDQT